jgi:hypothetical protein
MQKLLRAVIKPFSLNILQKRFKNWMFIGLLELSPSLIKLSFRPSVHNPVPSLQ